LAESVVFTGAGAVSCTLAASLLTADFFSAQPVKIIKLNINTNKIPIEVRFFFMVVPLFPYLKISFSKVKILQHPHIVTVKL
jgi:hypothetical protein